MSQSLCAHKQSYATVMLYKRRYSSDVAVIRHNFTTHST